MWRKLIRICLSTWTLDIMLKIIFFLIIIKRVKFILSRTDIIKIFISLDIQLLYGLLNFVLVTIVLIFCGIFLELQASSILIAIKLWNIL